MKTTPRENLKRDVARGKYILNPDFNETEEEAKETLEKVEAICFGGVGGGLDEFQSYYPEKYGKVVPEEGAWVTVSHPPCGTVYTVPPFSIWFAVPWIMDCAEISGRKIQRVRIQTPCGDLGLFPREYNLTGDIQTFLGREKDGVLFHRLSGDGMLPNEVLFYLQSRGIRRSEAAMMLLAQVRDPTFGWFELAPPYGKNFGRAWPTAKHCPFATPRKLWKETK